MSVNAGRIDAGSAEFADIISDFLLFISFLLTNDGIIDIIIEQQSL